MSKMLEAYQEHTAERAAMNVVPKPLDEQQTADLVELLKNPPQGEEATLLELFTHRIPPGVDQAAYVKAAFLSDILKGTASSPLIDEAKAVELLGTMQGGYNVEPLIQALSNERLAAGAAECLKSTILVFGISIVLIVTLLGYMIILRSNSSLSSVS